MNSPATPSLVSRAGHGIRERMANLVSPKESDVRSERTSERAVDARSSGREVPRQSDRVDLRTSSSGPKSDECSLTVLLVSGADVVLHVSKTSTVDQIKTRLFALPELAGCVKDDFVLGDASGKRTFVVEFQRLTRVDPSLAETIEAGGMVKLKLSQREPVSQSRSSMGGTPGMTRRKLGGNNVVADSPPAFSTPQPQRRAIQASPRAPLLQKSPREMALPKISATGTLLVSPREDEAARMRKEREAVLREKELLLQQKKERLEADRRADDARAKETAARERQEQARLAEEADRREERARQEREARRKEEEARAAEARRAEVEAKENGLRQKREALERKQRERSNPDVGDEVSATELALRKSAERDAEARNERARREEERVRREDADRVRREQVEEDQRMKELERRQMARDALAEQADDAESTQDEVQRQTMLDIERKKAEVEAKRAELERKMQELEERQRNLDRRRRESERQEREDKEAAAKDLRPSNDSSSDQSFDLIGERDTLWEMLREKQMAEDAKRKQLLDEKRRADDEAKRKQLAEEKRLRAEEEARREDMKRLEEAQEKEKREREQKEKEQKEKEQREKEQREKEARSSKESSQEIKSVPRPQSDSSEGSPKACVKHERRGSFGFLKKNDPKSDSGSSMPAATGSGSSNPSLLAPSGSTGEKSKGTPLLSRISMGVKGVRSVLVQRRNSFRSSKPFGGSKSSNPDDFPTPDEVADEDDLALFGICHEAVKRCNDDKQRDLTAREVLNNRSSALVNGKTKTDHQEYCLDNKFFWIESTYNDFSNWNHDDNFVLMLPHLDDTVYAERIRDLPHRNYIAMDEKIGPVIFTYSLAPDSNGDYCHVVWTDSGLNEFRVSGALYSQLPGDDQKLKLRLMQKILESNFNVSPTTKFTLTTREGFNDELDTMEHSLHSTNYKFGVLFAKEGQTQNEMFGNTETSPEFDRFLALLGDRISLLGWQGFRGGLDVKHGHTGTESVFCKFYMSSGESNQQVELDIMFHVSTMLPYSDKDSQQLERKRHLGNDIVVIVFLEGEGKVPYDPNILKSEFNHAFIIVQPLSSGRYRVKCIYKSGVPECHPFAPGPEAVFEHGQTFRRWLLAKCINSERASCQCVTFSQKLKRTRKLQMQMLCNSELEAAEKNQ